MSVVLQRFRDNESGQLSVIFSLTALSLVTMIGVSLDYARTERERVLVTGAADAATLSAVKLATEKPTLVAGTNSVIVDVEKTKAAAKTEADKVFENHMKVNGTKSAVTPATSIGYDSTTGMWSATIDYNAKIKGSFSGLIGLTELQYKGKSQAQASKGNQAYMDIYMMLDVSSSMGIGATDADTAAMVSLIGCAFGCHTPYYKATYYDKPRSKGIKMRIDVLREASQKLVDTAVTTAAGSGRIRIGAYTYNDKVTTLNTITSDLTTIKTKLGTVDLPTYEDGTNTSKAVTQMNSTIMTSGDGSASTKAKSFLFLITDGVEDTIYVGGAKPAAPGPYGMWGSTSAIDPALCNTLKSRGVTVAVLYTKYIKFTGWQYDGLIKPFDTYIPNNLKTCATSGFYFEASSATEINNAMLAMFQSAVKATTPTLTN